MTALASSLLAALPGGFTPFAVAGAAASAGVGGAFESLLAGLMAVETDGRPRMPGLADETPADAGQTAPQALLQPDNALTVLAAPPTPLPTPLPVASTTGESGATFTPEAPRPVRPSPVAAFRAAPATPVPTPANAGAIPEGLAEAGLAVIETLLPDLAASLAASAPVDTDASNAVASLAAQGRNQPHGPAAVAAPAAAPARTPTSIPAVTDRPDIETAGLPAATTPTVPGKASPARPDLPVRPGLVRQTQTVSQSPAAGPVDDQAASVPFVAAQPAVPAIPAQPVSATPAQPAVPAVPAHRTEAAAADAVPLAAPVKAVAPEGEARRPAMASRGDRPGQAAARPGPTPTAGSDRPAPVEIVAENLAATDGDGTEAFVPDAAPAELAEAPETRPPALPAEARAAAVSTAAAVTPETLVRGSPETVAKLAADIVRKLDGQTTRFDLELDPHGLGKVDVAIEIDRAGKMTAALTFDSAQSAADLRGRSGELRLALEQAGFDVSEGGLTFDLAGQGPGFGGREATQHERGWNGRAFQRAQSGAEEADAALAATTQPPTRTGSGIDIRI